MKDPIVERVREKYHTRSQVGIMKYGTTLAQNSKDNYFIHLQQELMDATLYIEKMLELDREITKLVKDIPNDQELGKAVRKLVS
jgi:hypothetical protein